MLKVHLFDIGFIVHEWIMDLFVHLLILLHLLIKVTNGFVSLHIFQKYFVTRASKKKPAWLRNCIHSLYEIQWLWVSDFQIIAVEGHSVWWWEIWIFNVSKLSMESLNYFQRIHDQFLYDYHFNFYDHTIYRRMINEKLLLLIRFEVLYVPNLLRIVQNLI